MKKLLLGLAVGLFACEKGDTVDVIGGSGSNPTNQITVLSSKQFYHNEAVALTIGNQSGQTVLLPLYKSAFREKLVNDEWVFWSNALYADPETPSLVVPAQGENATEVWTAKPGTYRVGFPVMTQSGASLGVVYSNPFIIY